MTSTLPAIAALLDQRARSGDATNGEWRGWRIQRITGGAKAIVEGSGCLP